jgi:hypothetical protein
MNEIHVALRAVTVRFPNVRERAREAFEHDESFREMCEEYQACAETVTRLQSAGASSDAVRLEYAALLFRLEGELLRYLEGVPNGGGRPGGGQ